MAPFVDTTSPKCAWLPWPALPAVAALAEVALAAARVVLAARPFPMAHHVRREIPIVIRTVIPTRNHPNDGVDEMSDQVHLPAPRPKQRTRTSSSR